MDRRVIDYLERRMRVSRDNEYRGDRRDYERDRRDYERGSDRRDYDYDERRGVRGTGRDYDYDRRDYGNDMNTSRNYNDRDYARGDRDYARDYRDNDYARDYNSQHEMRLSEEDMHRWKQKMQNEDGTKGEHYDMQQIMHVAEKLGIKMHNFGEKELCLTVNMLYSDYCKVVKKYLPVEKELAFYVDMARAFLEDKDGPKPEEKLALYYFCIADNDAV